jgi:SulP family sulfate permease
MASAAFVTAAFTIIACSSFANLIFAGPLHPFVTQGIWMGLFTALVVGVIVALASSYPGVIAIPQDRVAPIFGLMAANMTAQMASASIQEKAFAVIAGIAIVSLVTGSCLFLLGHLRLGNLIRYIPYPVIGGFLAGSGWLLVRGAIRIMTGTSLTFAGVPSFFRPEVLAHWLPGVLFGSVLFFSFRRLRHPLTLPVMLFGLIGAFWLFLFLSKTSLAVARQHGWLPDFTSGQSPTIFSSFYILNLAPWHLMAKEWSIWLPSC